MKKLFDLRFVIGLFFATVGLLLCIYYFIGTPAEGLSTRVNIWCGGFFMLFGLGMIILSFAGKEEDEA